MYWVRFGNAQLNSPPIGRTGEAFPERAGAAMTISRRESEIDDRRSGRSPLKVHPDERIVADAEGCPERPRQPHGKGR